MIIEQHNGVFVLRDDLLLGGTKSVFLHLLIDPLADYIVYASPVYGGMQIALAHYCAGIGKKAVIFCAKRKVPHANTCRAKDAGAMIVQVPFGYLSHVQSKASEFVQNNKAQLLRFGADYPAAISTIAARMQAVSEQLGCEPDEVYCAAGSGTLLRGIIEGTSVAKIKAVRVGAALDLQLPSRVELYNYPKPFEYESRYQAPFPSCRNYDLKAWEHCMKTKGQGNVLFWNVL